MFRFYQRKGGEGVAPVREFRPEVDAVGPPIEYELFEAGQQVGMDDGTLVLIDPDIAGTDPQPIVGVINGVSRYRVDTATDLPLFQPSGRLLDPTLIDVTEFEEVKYEVVLAMSDVIFMVDYAVAADLLVDGNLGAIYEVAAGPDHLVLNTAAPNGGGGWILVDYNNDRAKAYVRINPDRRSALLS